MEKNYISKFFLYFFIVLIILYLLLFVKIFSYGKDLPLIERIKRTYQASIMAIIYIFLGIGQIFIN